MTKNEVFQIVKEQIVDILPDIDPQEIQMEQRLTDLGANSLDRADITIASLEALGIKIPLAEFGNVQNIEGLVNLLHEKKAMQG
ncbi:MAG TPA: acyl carrier protein [Bacilli bacterium]